jgi:hypothetical protein
LLYNTPVARNADEAAAIMGQHRCPVCGGPTGHPDVDGWVRCRLVEFRVEDGVIVWRIRAAA